MKPGQGIELLRAFGGELWAKVVARYEKDRPTVPPPPSPAPNAGALTAESVSVVGSSGPGR